MKGIASFVGTSLSNISQQLSRLYDLKLLRRYSRKNEMKVKDAARILVEQVSKTNHLLQQITDA